MRAHFLGRPSWKNAVTDKRPVNLSIPTIRLPITAYVSILHRVSGLVLVLGFGVFLYLLDRSLSSPEGFARVSSLLTATCARVTIGLLLSAMSYHTCAGIRHLVMDLGIGESLKGGVLGARLVLAATAVLVFLSFYWVMSW